MYRMNCKILISVFLGMFVVGLASAVIVGLTAREKGCACSNDHDTYGDCCWEDTSGEACPGQCVCGGNSLYGLSRY